MSNQDNRVESPLEEVDTINAKKDPESPTPVYQQGDNDGAYETQMGQYDSGSGSKQYE